ncbi:hypothetical protein [Pyxidicoccus trucidator]|uniref:hypothetical protein n=1 Tax=Pyxidicoccus trucidator TaxID=2709662 RepID=UPI0013DAFEC1|nr:hypothetical protein [Pyxidicoccus trucidator]
MPPSNNADIYWRYTIAYTAALSGKEAVPTIPKDDGTAVHVAIAIGMHDGKANRTPRRLAELIAAVQIITSGEASGDAAAEF